VDRDSNEIIERALHLHGIETGFPLLAAAFEPAPSLVEKSGRIFN